MGCVIKGLMPLPQLGIGAAPGTGSASVILVSHQDNS